MPEATRERGSRDGEPLRATQPSADTGAAPEPDRDVENYRDEYDFPKRDPSKPAMVDHRS